MKLNNRMEEIVWLHIYCLRGYFMTNAKLSNSWVVKDNNFLEYPIKKGRLKGVNYCSMNNNENYAMKHN